MDINELLHFLCFLATEDLKACVLFLEEHVQVIFNGNEINKVVCHFLCKG